MYPSRRVYQGGASRNDATKPDVTERLRRIEGQAGGLLRMVEYDRYRVDVLTQINALRAAPRKVEGTILRDYFPRCVADAFASANVAEQRHKVGELIVTIEKMTR